MNTRPVNNMNPMKRAAWPALLLLFVNLVALQQQAGAARQTSGVVNISAPDGSVVIYWDNPNVFAGQMLAVVNGNNSVGVVMATEVTAYYVKAKLVSGRASEGDRVLTPQESSSALPPTAQAQQAQPAGPALQKQKNPTLLKQREPRSFPAETSQKKKPDAGHPPSEKRATQLEEEPAAEPQPATTKPEKKKKEKIENEDGSPGKTAAETTAAKPAEERKKNADPGKGGKPDSRIPVLGRLFLLAVGGGVFSPSGSLLSGESPTVDAEIIASIPFVTGYEFSAGFGAAMPGFKSSGVADAGPFSQKITFSRTTVSIATKPKSILFLPSLSLGAGYSMNNVKYDLCSAACSSTKFHSSGPHLLARVRTKFPVSLIAEARYQWDTSSDIDGLKTNGLELSVLFPFGF